MNWGRTILGPPGRDLGRGRWPLVAVGAAVLAVLWASIGDWTYAVGAALVAAACAVMTVRSFR